MPKVAKSGTHVRSSLAPFELASETDSGVTAFAGVPLLVETWHAMGMTEIVERELHVRKRDCGIRESSWVEALTVLPLVGGKTVEDLSWLKEDPGLAQLWPGLRKLTPRSALNFLHRFHDENIKGGFVGTAVIQEESKGLRELAKVNVALIGEIQRRVPVDTATIDLDASVHPSRKQQALPCYEGGRAYQPVIVVWAERKLVLVDQFRDGNVPAAMGNLPVLQRAIESLPAGVKHRYVRGDSAMYDQDVLAWLAKEKIPFAISADMTRALRQEVEKVPPSAWKPVKDRDGIVREEGRFWAEVEFVSAEKHPKGTPPFRYVAIRLPQQQEIWEKVPNKVVAIVTNQWEIDGNELINWHREKCGTVEHAHDLFKNDLAARSFPSGKFGANAAWYRLNVLANNLQIACALLALDEPKIARTRPSTFAFRFIRRAGRVVRHARSLLLYLGAFSTELLSVYEAARSRLADIVAS